MEKARTIATGARHGRSAPGARLRTVRPRGTRTKGPRDHRRMHEASWSRADAVAVLDAPERRVHQDPVRLWRRVGLKTGDIVVDVGAGSGFYAFPAAAAVGANGHVYAVDTSKELVELIRERAQARQVPNVEPVLSSPARIPIEDATADIALLANVLHGLPPKTLDEAIRLLRPGGRLVDVDWKKKPTPDGPPVEHRLALR